MKHIRITFLTLLSVMAANTSSFGNYAWSENAGWLNAGTRHGGISVFPDGASGYLEGYAWAENFGWVKLGDGSGGPYANNSAIDWGVNMDAFGNSYSHYGHSQGTDDTEVVPPPSKTTDFCDHWRVELRLDCGRSAIIRIAASATCRATAGAKRWFCMTWAAPSEVGNLYFDWRDC